MAHSDSTEILLLHNKWANGQLIDACAGLTAAQFNQPFEMGLGTLERTITHILGAMRGWADLLAGRDWQPRLEENSYAVEQLRDLLDEVNADFCEHARAHPVEGEVTRERGGKTYTFTRGGVITHVMTHGMHHRAQCINMLRQLGVDPMPPSSVVEWMLMVDSSA